MKLPRLTRPRTGADWRQESIRLGAEIDRIKGQIEDEAARRQTLAVADEYDGEGGKKYDQSIEREASLQREKERLLALADHALKQIEASEAAEREERDQARLKALDKLWARQRDNAQDVDRLLIELRSACAKLEADRAEILGLGGRFTRRIKDLLTPAIKAAIRPYISFECQLPARPMVESIEVLGGGREDAA